MSTVYLIHFNEPYKRAKHYLGATKDLPKRLSQHASGNGARLLEVIQNAGIGYEVVRTWVGYFELERELKKQKNSARFCPKCQEEKL